MQITLHYDIVISQGQKVLIKKKTTTFVKHSSCVFTFNKYSFQIHSANITDEMSLVLLYETFEDAFGNSLL